MSNIRYYTDEHVSRAVIRGLRERGIDILSVPEADMMGAKDDEHLEFALRESRVLFTQDTDFLRLAAEGREHAGIIHAPQGTGTGQIIRGLLLIQQVLTAEDMFTNIEFL